MSYGEIERGIPFPPDHGKGRKSRFPQIRGLEVGDSVLYPAEVATLATKAAYNFGQNLARKFTTAKQPNGDLRIWRTE